MPGRVRKGSHGALTIDEAASLVGVDRKTAYACLRHGLLPGAKVGTRWIVLRADLPGLDEKDIEVRVQDNTLTIQGERKEEKEEKKEDYYCSERAYGAFMRSLTLPASVDASKIKATFKKGVLEVHLPKAKEAKGTKIEIKAA